MELTSEMELFGDNLYRIYSILICNIQFRAKKHRQYRQLSVWGAGDKVPKNQIYIYGFVVKD